MRHSTLIALALPLYFSGLAHADFAQPGPGEVALRDVPGSGRHWQEARSIVDAPPDAVRRWLTEYEFWPGRFHDVISVRVIDRRGAQTRFAMRSKIMDREMVLDAKSDGHGVFYETHDGSVHGYGRIYVTPTEDGRTDVVMQSSARITGLLGVIAPTSMIRDRARAKLTSDLRDLQRLARQHGGTSDADESLRARYDSAHR